MPYRLWPVAFDTLPSTFDGLRPPQACRGVGCRLGVVGLAIGMMVGSCRSDSGAPPPAADTEQSIRSASEGPLLVNDEFEITKMATADDVLIVEVDATSSVDAGELARSLVEPVQDRYPEVVVYVRWPADSARPSVKIQ